MPTGVPAPTAASPAPSVRRLLLDEAARVLAEQGPAALSARRLVKAVGASTMAVYTHFGSMPNLIREVMREGFDRFRIRALAVPQSEDAVAAVAALCRCYQDFARDEPHVYAVLFGGSTLAGFELDDEDRSMGVSVLRLPRDAVRRSVAAGRFRADVDPDLLVRQLFAQMHGIAQLDRAGYIMGGYTPEDVLTGALVDFAVAAGDERERAARSVAGGLRANGVTNPP
ncbi:TetR/AcrR family transcriptional regulator [Streptomyces sp. NPDC018833]|uniref:TetR/AcrR family transcriptional regulator n=1 Tax=Streptomyces sp. NPDC018833 TaxID=3365053 RepID=UPI0037882FBA